MPNLKAGALGGAVCVLVTTGLHPAHAQVPLVNCGMFRNPADQARCAQSNQAAIQAYRNERLTTYGYYGAKGLNSAGGYIAGRVVPGYGGLAYQGGGAIGTYMYNNQQPPRVYAPPPLPQPTYRPPQLPRQLRPYAPIYPNYGR